MTFKLAIMYDYNYRFRGAVYTHNVPGAKAVYLGEGVGVLPFLGLVIIYSWSSGIRYKKCGPHLEPLGRDILGTIIIKGWSFFRC